MIPELSHLDPNVRARVEAEVRDDEDLVWVGRPKPWLLARAALPTFLFGIPFFGFAVFWTVGAWAMTRGMPASGNGPAWMQTLFPFFGLPFLLVGAGLLLSPVLTARAARRSVYAITTKRAIVFDAGLNSMTVRSYDPDDLNDLSRRENASGAGDLVFEEFREQSRWNNNRPRTRRRGFLAINDVAPVERLLRTTLALD